MTNSTVRYYYVDEAGDGTIFDARGRVIIGHEGCSRFFMLGLLDVVNPVALNEDPGSIIGGLFRSCMTSASDKGLISMPIAPWYFLLPQPRSRIFMYAQILVKQSIS